MSTTDSPSVRQVISDVRQDLNSVNLDDWIPAKYIHHKLLDNAKLFMKREADDRRLYLYADIWTPINVFPLKESTLIECSDIAVPHCNTVMKSEFKLPSVFSTRYGYALKIYSLDYSIEYTPITPSDYINIKKSRYQNPKKRYCWLSNDYLIIPDAFVQSVTIRGIFINQLEAKKLDQCCDGNTQPQCMLMLDQKFPVPGHLLGDVKKATILELAQIRKQIVPDEYPQLNQLEKKSPVSK